MSAYRKTNERFINPYNFVSINDDVVPSDVNYGSLTGIISCELETLSPLFIPNTSKDNAFSAKYSHSYDFFSYEDLSKRNDYCANPAMPIIPGASIRGVMRSAFEAATNGCMSSCDDDNTLYRRTPVPRKSYGIIEKVGSERILYKAAKSQFGSQNWDVKHRGDHQTGEDILGDGGVYLRGENFPFGKTPKKYDAVLRYAIDATGEKVEIARFTDDSREWKNFIEVWRLYQHRKGKIKGVNQNDKPGKAEYNSGYPGYFNAEKLPVYYTQVENGGFYYLAPAAITKEVFSRTLPELLEKQGGHNPCDKADSLCPACALFGIVGEDARASRLFFKDAAPVGIWRDYYDSVRALPILSSPKVSATEFYMEDVDGAAYFNYDYYVQYYHGSKKYEPVRTPLASPKLRGRKLYWHRKTPVIDNTTAFGNQRTEIRPLKAKSLFKFEIAFDRLSQSELETLLWVLTFGDKNATHAHKLGSGKPVGYGSARITKATVKAIRLNDDFTFSEQVIEVTPKMPPKSDALLEYLAMTDYEHASDLVQYPIGETGKSYEWFGVNKQIQQGAFNPSFNYVLPKPTGCDVTLPKYERGDGDIGGNRKPAKAAKHREESSDTTTESTSQPNSSSADMRGSSLADRLADADAEKKKQEDEKRELEISKANSKLSALTQYNKAAKAWLDKFLKEHDGSSEYKAICEKIHQRYKKLGVN
jgi:CRISPR/Cas system CSM-associated protein Csm3 (group 7 of RAMP superfamily)